MSLTDDDQEGAARWIARKGREIVAEIDRLWPLENDPGYRAQCLSEEAGEVSRAITKRRHASHAPDGLCKGLTVDEWTEQVELELAQALGVAFDIAERENINLVGALERCVETLQNREAGS